MKNIIYIIILITTFNSCDKKTTFDIEYPNAKLVVNAIINPDSLCKVYVSKSLNPTDVINFKELTNASVELFKNGSSIGFLNEYIETNKNPGLGYYTNSHVLIEANDSLEIKVLHNNFDTASAKTFIPVKPIVGINISSYSIEKFPPPSKAYGFTASMQININDENISDNYYSITMFYYANEVFYPFEGDTLYKEKINFEINSDNVIKSYKFNEGYIISNKDFSVELNSFSIKVNDILKLKQTDFENIYIEVKSISKDYYLYQKTMKEYYQAIDNPFSEPLKVYSNINSGYGIFAGYNSIIDTFTIDIDTDLRLF